MLFNSFEFMFLFFPLTVLLYFLAVRFVGQEFGLGLLVVASLFFLCLVESCLYYFHSVLNCH